MLVNALNSDEYERAMIGVLLRETRSLCHANFQSFKFSFLTHCNKVFFFMGTHCNKVAHEQLTTSGGSC